MKDYLIAVESTADLNVDYYKEHNNPVISYSYLMDEKEYFDLECDKVKFYNELNAGKQPTTTQINYARYEAFFLDLLKENKDVLFITFSSGLTGSVNNAINAANDLNEKNENKIYVLDSLCASSSYGLLVDIANANKENGISLKENFKQINQLKNQVNARVLVGSLDSLIRGGRVSKLKGIMGKALGICPILQLTKDGKIEIFDKIKGKKNALNKLVSCMEESANDGLDYSDRIYIAHGNALEEANLIKEFVKTKFTKAKEIKVFELGTVIGCHIGSGTVCLFYLGKEKG